MKRMRSRRMRILAWASIAMAGVLVAVTLSAYVVIRIQLGHITHVKQIDVRNRPHRYTNALNILLLGSDTRSGHNGAIGGRVGCNCSDTLMIAHISPGRGRITVVSIPRDTMVPYYACSPWEGTPGQQANPNALERINATLANGGPECVRETVEQQTGIYINNFIQLDFTGFEKVINDVGGVNVCIPFAINNAITANGGSGLRLGAGFHHINGRVALQFWRTRENIADGSDTARIARDQYLMAQVVKGVLHSGLLTSPTKLYRVMGDVASAMSTDATTSDLLNIASSLSGISLSKVQFITAPWAPYPPDPNELEFAQPQADALFTAIAHDRTLPRTKKTKGSGGQLLTVSPSKVKVMVLNGSAVATQAGQAAAALSSRGFTVLGTGNATTTGYTKSVVEYSSKSELAAANTLSSQFSSVAVEKVPGLAVGTVQVIIGSTFTALAPRHSSKPKSVLSGLAAHYNGITANVPCRNSAFYGYYDPAPASGIAACKC